MKTKLDITFLFYVCVVAALFILCDCKRGGGGRRGGTYRGSSSVWSKSKQSQSGSNYDLYNSRGKSKGQTQAEVPKKATVDTYKASAPPSPAKSTDPKQTSGAFIDQEKNHNVQQKPIGWDTQNKNTPANSEQRPIGWNVNRDSGSVNKQSVSSLGNSNTGNLQPSAPVGVNPPPYSPGTGQQNYGNPPPYSSGTGHYNYGNPPAYSPGTGQHNSAYPPAYNQPQYGNPPPYSYGGGQHAYGSGLPPHGVGSPYGAGYPNQFNPHQTVPNYGSGMYNPYGGQKSGGLGSLFGGNKYGNMGYGGFGGYGVGGYGKKFGGGFGMGFGKNAYRNIAIGLLVWNLVSGFTRRPYYVYNYYNNPEKVPQEIPLPANAIVTCADNITTLCAPNTLPLCTSQESIFCVVLAQQTFPCTENSTMKCVNSTVSCIESDDENCKEFASNNDTTTVNLPCVSSVTVTGNVSDSTIPLPTLQNSTNFCVTTMAVPQPDEDIKKSEELKCTSNSTENAACLNVSPTSVAPVEVLANSTALSSANINATYPLAM